MARLLFSFILRYVNEPCINSFSFDMSSGVDLVGILPSAYD